MREKEGLDEGNEKESGGEERQAPVVRGVG